MNWDNQNKDPWGGKNDAPDFDDLVKKFSSILGGKKATQPMESYNKRYLLLLNGERKLLQKNSRMNEEI